MKTTNKFFSVFLALIMIISIIPMSTITVGAETLATSGACGENLTWNFNEEAGILTISGTGAMTSYDYTNCPWKNYRNSIQTVIIENGVTTIGSYAFYNCPNLSNIEIPESITTIGNSAFRKCVHLTEVVIPNSVTLLENGAFNDCTNLSSIKIGTGITQINSATFMNCTNLKTVIIAGNITKIDGSAFRGCDSLTKVYYCGDDWTNVMILTGNEALNGVQVQYHVMNLMDEPPPSCTEDRHIQYHCEFCSYEYTTVEPATGHYYSTKTTPPTCTEQGCTAYTCLKCGDILGTPTYTPATGHTNKTIIQLPTCTVAGKSYNECETCGYTTGLSAIIPATGHTAGEWEVALEPTYEANGKKVQKCIDCSEVVAKEIIPILVKTTVTDKDTDISMEYTENHYDGEVKITVEELFNGTPFDIIGTKLDAAQTSIYDIAMTVDAEITQPNSIVEIKIPLPKGYDPNYSFVYSVNTETKSIEKMPTKYENGCLVFKTTHLNYYAVVEEYNYTFSIQTPSRTELRNKDGIILHAVVEGNAPEGLYVKWESNNKKFNKDADGSNLKIIAKNKGWTTFTAILYDADGNELARDFVEMYSKSGLFDKIGGLFRSIFRTTKIYEN
jgi:hypothetical protein